ncbi:MAG: glycosyltransferase [Bacteroidetes bacterium]|nr:glycosyltransferase [Bacteroidota bacterium]
MGVPVRVYFNHGVPYAGYRGILRWLLRSLERWNMALATHVVTVSQDMVTLLRDVSPDTKAQIIQNGSASGIDLESFSPGLYSRANWRKALGLRDEDLVVVYVGRAERRKGFLLVLHLWADHFRKTDVKLVMCGPDEEDVQKHLSEIPSNLIALGFVNNVAEVLACSDLLILPSLHEGLSCACMEAQASGTLIVANDISGLRCLIKDGVSGILIPDNTREKYIEIIEKINKDRTAFADIRQQARKNIEKFSRKLYIPAYLAFLRGLGQK